MSLDAPELPFRDLIDAAPDGVIVCDQAGLIVLVNAEIERMFGYSRGELAGQRIDMLVPDHARPQHSRHVAGYTASPRLRPMGIGMELTGRRKDGAEIPVEISLSPIRTSASAASSSATTGAPTPTWCRRSTR
jgi:PAS domain S-box-containing protein